MTIRLNCSRYCPGDLGGDTIKHEAPSTDNHRFGWGVQQLMMKHELPLLTITEDCSYPESLYNV